MKKTIITVVGQDQVGIIAKVCTYLAQNDVNVLNITQSITDGWFNMMMITDTNDAGKPVAQLSDELAREGEEIGVIIKMRHEDIFKTMHRI